MALGQAQAFELLFHHSLEVEEAGRQQERHDAREVRLVSRYVVEEVVEVDASAGSSTVVD